MDHDIKEDEMDASWRIGQRNKLILTYTHTPEDGVQSVHEPRTINYPMAPSQPPQEPKHPLMRVKLLQARVLNSMGFQNQVHLAGLDPARPQHQIIPPHSRASGDSGSPS